MKSEEQTKPSNAVPEIHFQVSSAHLKAASRYFQKAFDGKFKESQPGSDGLLRVDASGWDTKALLIVLRIIHGQNRQVAKAVDLELLAKIAVIMDYYDCHETLDAWAELWLYRLKDRFILLHRLDRDLVLLLLVSWVFGWANEFKLATKIVLRESKGPLHTLGLPIPEAITCKFSAILSIIKPLINEAIAALNTQRLETIRRIGSALGVLVAHLQADPPPCSFECASMNLGALSRQIHNKKLLYYASSWFLSLDGQNVISTMGAARTIQSPNWSCMDRRGPFCHLNPVVQKKMDDLENVEGFNLEDYAKGK